MAKQPTDVSRVRIERVAGPLRLAYLPAEPEPVRFGTHRDVAARYGIRGTVAEPHATTLDYIVAAAGGRLVGTLGGALEARGIAASGGKLIAEVEGDVETEDRVLVLRRIRVRYVVTAPGEHAEVVDRVHGIHKEHCPVYRSIHRAIEVTTSYELQPG